MLALFISLSLALPLLSPCLSSDWLTKQQSQLPPSPSFQKNLRHTPESPNCIIIAFIHVIVRCGTGVECCGFKEEITSSSEKWNNSLRLPSLKAWIMSWGTLGTRMYKVGKDTEQDLRGKRIRCREMRCELEFHSPPVYPLAVWQGVAYIRISIKLDQTLHNMSIQRKMIKSWVNAPNTTRPLPSVWASALHNCFCVLSCLHVHVIHWFTAHTWDVGQWRSSALYNSFKAFIHPQPPYFNTRKNSNTG